MNRNKKNEKTADFLFAVALLIFGGVILDSILQTKLPSLYVAIAGVCVFVVVVGAAYKFLSKIDEE